MYYNPNGGPLLPFPLPCPHLCHDVHRRDAARGLHREDKVLGSPPQLYSVRPTVVSDTFPDIHRHIHTIALTYERCDASGGWTKVRRLPQ